MSEATDIWSAEKIAMFREEFMAFINVCAINSKETGGNTILGEHIFGSQTRVLDEIFAGLAEGKHDFKVLKSRQLGISTFARAFSLFWLGVHDGLQGAMIFDTDANKENARRELEAMIDSLPAFIKFPRIKVRNRYGIILENGSKLQFLSAGTRKGRSGGGLGRSSGLNFIHASEMCQWENEEGVEALKPSLSKKFPNRLYIWESTARGPNLWQTMWEEAVNDDITQKPIFIGWWSRDDQRLETGSALYRKYAKHGPTDKELERMAKVKELYDVDIDMEQLAWFRSVVDPDQSLEEDESEDPLKTQEQPWTAEEAFQITGSTFFSPTKLTQCMSETASPDFQSYKFFHGTDFFHTRVEKARSLRETQLKIWEEPVSDATYVISADPAYGHRPENNHSAIQVLRCYADRIEQVAEFADSETPTSQFAWVIAALCGWYGVGPNGTYKNHIEVIIEINGPGEAVLNSFKDLKNVVNSPSMRREATERGLKNIFQNVKNYMYARSDSYAAGNSLHWKCLALDTPIPTPVGWTKMGDLKSGDAVFDDLGKPCRVVHAFPVLTGHECFKLSFDDRSTIIADDAHVWRTSDGVLRKTIELKVGQQIDLSEPLKLPETYLPISPYMLGVWLGDGYSMTGMICGHKDDLPFISKRLEECGESLSPAVPDKRNENVLRQRVNGLSARLTEFGLIGNKYIPDNYLRASYEQRMELLRGLMDTDGSITKGRLCTFCTSNEAMRDDFSELLRTLGIKPKMSVIKKKLIYKGEDVEAATSYQFYFTSYPDVAIFTLPRKLEKQFPTTSFSGNGPPGKYQKFKSKRHTIVSIEKTNSLPVRCIEVDSESRLYLAGVGMIPTHNTTGQLKEAIFERLRDWLYSETLVIRSMAVLQEMQKIVRDGETIGAPGMQRDDRTFSLAMGIRSWEDRLRRPMLANGQTKQKDSEKRKITPQDKFAIFNRHQIESMFKRSQMNRIAALRENRYKSWHR